MTTFLVGTILMCAGLLIGWWLRIQFELRQPVPNFDWPSCPRRNEGITVYRSTSKDWQLRCQCGFSWTNGPHEALRLAETKVDHPSLGRKRKINEG